MTEPQETTPTTTTKRYSLLHLSNISFWTQDIVSVSWNTNQELPVKLIVTKIRTRYEIFILRSDSPSYQDDIKRLEEAVGR